MENKEKTLDWFKSSEFEDKLNTLEEKKRKQETAEKVLVWQSNFITSARYEMTPLEKNIFYMVISMIKKSDQVGSIYRVSALELMNITGTEISYDRLKKATGKMVGRVIEGLEKNGNWLQATLFSSVEYITGKGIIEIELSQKMYPYFVDLQQNFTTYQLNTALSLSSIYSKRIYEMMSMYKNMKDKSFKIEYIEFKKRLNLIDLKTGKDKYPKFTHLKINVLDVADKEINGHTDIYFSYKTIEGKKLGQGRKAISHIEFKIIYEPSEDKKREAYMGSLYERLTNDFKLRKDQANLVLEKYSREEINRELYQINIKMTNKEIRDVGAFTAKVFAVHEAK